MINVFEHDSDWVLKPASHFSDELTLVLNGEGFLFTSCGQNISLSKGVLFLIPSGTIHGSVSTKPISFAVIHFFAQYLSSYCRVLYNVLYNNENNKINTFHFHNTILDDFQFYFHKLKQEVLSGHEQKNEAIRVHLESIFLLLYRSSTFTQTQQPSIYNVVMLSCKDIEENFNTSLKIEELSTRYFLSESYFRLKFKEIVGVSPKQYLLNIRLNESKRLLLNTNKSITSIAKEVGFTSQYQFNSIFTEREGTPPSIWRKREYNE